MWISVLVWAWAKKSPPWRGLGIRQGWHVVPAAGESVCRAGKLPELHQLVAGLHDHLFGNRDFSALFIQQGSAMKRIAEIIGHQVVFGLHHSPRLAIVWHWLDRPIVRTMVFVT